MYKLIFPIGGGGSWLTHVVYGLVFNNFEVVEPHNNINFHSKYEKSVELKAHGIEIDHQYILDEDEPHAVFGGLRGVFSTYVNAIVKFYALDEEEYSTYSFVQRVNFLTDVARYSLSKEYSDLFLKNITLNYDDIYYNHYQFTHDLFKWLDSTGIPYKQNDLYVDEMIQQYTNTFDPMQYYDTDTIEWIGWCHGMLNHYNINVLINMSELKRTAEFLPVYNEHKEFILSKTREMIL